jgi:hypothetical protein
MADLITRESAIERLKGLRVTGDIEIGHAEADDVLCELLAALGYGDVVQEYGEVEKWYA